MRTVWKAVLHILDFRDASRMFADPAFDGEPVQIFEPAPDGPMVPDEDEPTARPTSPPRLIRTIGRMRR